jgi:hypothetical protein
MDTLTLQRRETVDRLEQIATEQGTAAEELLDVAVREFLDKVAHQKIRAESAAFREMHAQLVAKYPGEYVAIHNGKVVDHDPDVRTLHLRVRQRYGRLPILLRQVTEKVEQRDLVFRSPKLEHAR